MDHPVYMYIIYKLYTTESLLQQKFSSTVLQPINENILQEDSDSDSSGGSSSDVESNNSSSEEDDDRNCLEDLPRARRRPQLTASNLKMSELSLTSNSNKSIGSISSTPIPTSSSAVLAKSKFSDVKTLSEISTYHSKTEHFSSLSPSVADTVSRKKEAPISDWKSLPFKKPSVDNCAFKTNLDLSSKPVENIVQKKTALKEENLGESCIYNSSDSVVKKNIGRNKVNESQRHEYVQSKKGNTPSDSKKVSHHKISTYGNKDSPNFSRLTPVLKQEKNDSNGNSGSVRSKLITDSEDLADNKASVSTISNWKLEKRRLKKKQEMEMEFDKLLKSSKPSKENKKILDQKDKNTEVKKHGRISPSAKETYQATVYNKLVGNTCGISNFGGTKINVGKSTTNDFSTSKKSNNSIFDSKSEDSSDSESDDDQRKPLVDSEQKRKSSCKYLTSSKTKNTINNNNYRNETIRNKELKSNNKLLDRNKLLLSESENVINSYQRKQEPATKNCGLTTNIDFSSDSKSLELSSTTTTTCSSSSESEDSLLPLSSYKRTPSLHVNAKVIKPPQQQRQQNDNRLSSPSKKTAAGSNSKNTLNNSKNSVINKKSNKKESSVSPNKRKGEGLKDSLIRPTIADVVKVRERRKSLDKDSANSSSSVTNSSDDKSGNLSQNDDDGGASSSSEASDDLNEKIDVDTEQTQTFSVSENNFNQVCKAAFYLFFRIT